MAKEASKVFTVRKIRYAQTGLLVNMCIHGYRFCTKSAENVLTYVVEDHNHCHIQIMAPQRMTF